MTASAFPFTVPSARPIRNLQPAPPLTVPSMRSVVGLPASSPAIAKKLPVDVTAVSFVPAPTWKSLRKATGQLNRTSDTVALPSTFVSATDRLSNPGASENATVPPSQKT